MITRKDISVPSFYQGYVNSIEEDDLKDALSKNTRRFRKFLKSMPGKKINYAYAEGKWTVKELLQHIIDAERVFVYRALSFARKDSAMLPAFDENVWAITAKAPKRKWNDLVDEWRSLRAANEAFFASLDEEQLQQTGTANNNTMSVAVLGFVVAGHAAHHMRIIKERYLGKEGEESKERKEKKERKEVKVARVEKVDKVDIGKRIKKQDKKKAKSKNDLMPQAKPLK